ncbi:MAG TPA: helix-turn-helix domain-containing protein [Solirubrobacterales bacterium]
MAPTIGQKLRQARAERGVELSEVERATKIRAKFLEAMEEDRWEELPAPVYARGFLDIYARYLGLDQQALLDEYRHTVEGEQHEPIPQSVIKPGTLRQTRPVGRSRSINWGPVAKVLGGLIVVAVVGLVIVGSIGGSDDSGGSDNGGKGRNQGSKAAGPSKPATTTTSTTPAGEVSVELRATALVWVCLVDDGGTPLVDSETLDANESRGPFSGGGFDVTFGNGSVEMTVDGDAARIPQVAEPIGYRITPTGVRKLDPSSQPTCV